MGNSSDTIETLNERIVYENDWVVVRDDDVCFPSGAKGTYYYPQWKAPHGVAIIVLVGRNILLLRNYRYAEKTHCLEIPMGFGTEGATPEEDARREMREEIGVEPDILVPVTKFGALYVTHLFLWRVEKLPKLVHGHQETSEAISGYELIPLDGLNLAGLAAIGIHDPMSVAAIFIAKALADDDLFIE